MPPKAKEPTAAPLVAFTVVPKGTQIAPAAALTIEQAFAPYVQQFQELSAHVSTITDPKEAKVARLKLRKVRTDTDKKHQEMKAESLAYGRTLDTAKNLINAQIEPIEEQLEKIEKAEERRIAQILADRRDQHLSQLRPYLDAGMPEPFVDGMTDQQFAIMLDNAKLAHQAKIDRKEREEKERLERERLEREERERQQAELERLREESLQQQERLRLEREEQERLRQEQEEKHRKQREADAAEAKRLQDIADEKFKKLKAENDAKLKKEQDKLAEQRRQSELQAEQARLQREELERQQRERDEAENARRQEEERRKQEQADAAEKAAQAPDKEKLLDYAAAIFNVEEPAMKTKKGKAMVAAIISDVHDLLENIRSQAAKL